MNEFKNPNCKCGSEMSEEKGMGFVEWKLTPSKETIGNLSKNNNITVHAMEWYCEKCTMSIANLIENWNNKGRQQVVKE
jgi:hypothetical protein